MNQPEINVDIPEVKRTPKEIQQRIKDIGKLINDYDRYGPRGWFNTYILLAKLNELDWLTGNKHEISDDLH